MTSESAHSHDASLHSDRLEVHDASAEPAFAAGEVSYDDADTRPLDGAGRSAVESPERQAPKRQAPKRQARAPSEAMAAPSVAEAAQGCHAGAEKMRAAAKAGANAPLMEKLAADYPLGPHDKPQSMCPAFGSLRVGLRMRRTASVLCGSACCVYGLTFTSHFYGARRTVGYVPFNSETLVTGKLFEDLRDAVFELADPALYDTVIVTNLCVPTASGVPLRLLPKEINGVRIVGIDVPGFGVPTHAEAKDVLAGAMLAYARAEAEQGPVARPQSREPATGAAQLPTVTLVGEMFPADPMTVGQMLAPLGLAAGPVVPTREWRELYAALDCAAVAAIHPFYTASIREFQAAGRKVVGSAPVGVEGTAGWLAAIGRATGASETQIATAIDAVVPAIRAALAANPIKARITVSGYEGSELLVARLLVEAGADVRYVGTACPRTVWSEADRDWLQARGAIVQYRASLEQDLAALAEFKPDLAIGTTPVVQKAKEQATPALYFTNLISARPLMGIPGAAALAHIINGALRSQERFAAMRAFFEGTGRGDTAGIWEDVPASHDGFKERYAARLSKAKKNEGAIGC